MEKLLNKLIEKGWKPRNVISKNTYIYKVKDKINLSYSEFLEDEGEYMHEDEWYSLRDLVSKGSGLWQFVCENHLYIYKMGENKNFIQDHFKNEYNECCYQYLWDKSCYEYYLLESSLTDESELEDFLLQNIKVDVESK